MSTFLAIGLYFMFARVWSLRNLDICLLLLLTPGLMMVYEGRKIDIAAQSPTPASQAVPVDLAQTSSVRRDRVQESTLQKSTLQTPTVQTSPGKSSPRPSSPRPSSPRPSSPRPSSPAQTLPSPSATTARFVALQETEANTGRDSETVSDSLEPVSASDNGTEPPSWTAAQLRYYGFVWLLIVTGCLIVRMLLDTSLVRRPMLEPNLSIGGLTFLGISLFLFLMANILTSTPKEQSQSGMRMGPGYVLLNKLPDITTTPRVFANMNPTVNSDSDTSPVGPPGPQLSAARRSTMVARIVAILANMTIVGGIIAIGGFHFHNLKTGIGVAVFCILLPYASQMCGRLDHVLPAAMLILAILLYRNPILAGLSIGAAAGLVYFPFFLLPLWMSFYWQRGLKRFCVGLVISLGTMAVSTVLLADDNALLELRRMFGLFPIASENLGGVWGLGWHPYFRLPMLVGFGLLSFSFTLWPAQKNLATLLSCSAAIMMAAQFGHGYGGGLFIAWFLPLAALSIFRPNLDDRIAIRMVRLWGHKPKRVVADEDEESNELAIAG
jgi:hypothetical protein